MNRFQKKYVGKHILFNANYKINCRQITMKCPHAMSQKAMGKFVNMYVRKVESAANG